MLACVLMAGLCGCSERTNPRVVTKLNQDAMLTGDLPSNPLKGTVITSWINKQDSTMSTLFGNDVAVQFARTNLNGKYPAGSVLSVVTWEQQEDSRWFGGNIPRGVKRVEIVTVTGPEAFLFDRYEGTPLKRVVDRSFDAMDAAVKRATYVMGQRAAVMP
jgi:hypothetical protein